METAEAVKPQALKMRVTFGQAHDAEITDQSSQRSPAVRQDPIPRGKRVFHRSLFDATSEQRQIIPEFDFKRYFLLLFRQIRVEVSPIDEFRSRFRQSLGPV